MARQAERVGGEDHRPGNIGRPPPQFAVHEVGEPPEQHPEADIDRDVIAYPDEGESAAPGDVADRQQHADQPAVEAHAAFPQLEEGKAAPQFRLVEGGIAEPAAQDNAECAVKEQVIRVPLRHRAAGRLHHPAEVPIAKDDPGKVSERIPAQREEAEVDPRLQTQLAPPQHLARSGGQHLKHFSHSSAGGSRRAQWHRRRAGGRVGYQVTDDRQNDARSAAVEYCQELGRSAKLQTVKPAGKVRSTLSFTCV